MDDNLRNFLIDMYRFAQSKGYEFDRFLIANYQYTQEKVDEMIEMFENKFEY